MDIKSFYQHSPDEIAMFFREFLAKDFFVRYPQWLNRTSVVITGSVSSGRYDQYSDIDSDFLVVGDGEKDRLFIDIKEYKSFIRQKSLPIQIHNPVTFSDLEADLNNYNKDGIFRECSRALIVQDPEGRYRAIREKISWYPDEVLHDKFQWLFAEAVFSFQDRFVVAVFRKNIFYIHALSIHIMKHLGNALLLLNKRYPVFDKHLFFELQSTHEEDFCSLMRDILEEKDPLEVQRLLDVALFTVEERLIESGNLERKTRDAWVLARPRYQVDLGQ